MPAKQETQNSYLERVNKVLNYVRNHLDEELSIEKLAEMSYFSMFHFHRIMTAFLGESIMSYIKRQRLELSVQLLKNTNFSVTDIAYKIGYDTPSSYTKAFKNMFGVSPNDFRKFKKELKMENLKAKERHTNFKPVPEIVVREEKQIVYTSIVGEYSGNIDYKGAWSKVCGYAGQSGLFNGNNEFLCISYDDPKVTPAGKQRCDICVTVDKQSEPKGDIFIGTLHGGKFAKFQYKGPYMYLSEIWDAIFSEWLPNTDIELRFVPCFEKYVNSPDDTAPEDLITEIFVGIK